jgi:hypothetical protein
MPKYEFITSVVIEADNYDSAVDWFDFETKDLDTHVSEIKEVK